MIKLFSGSANPKLTQQVADILKINISKSEVVRFANSEVRVRIEEDVKNKTCVIIQPTSNPTDTNLIELVFFCDALRRQEAKKVIAIIPYFGYARQDIMHRDGECISANVVIRFLESIGFSKVYTIDLHDEATQGVFSIPFKNLTALPIMANEIKKFFNNNISNAVVVSPDQGGIERTRDFGEYFFGQKDFPMAVIEKKRNLTTIHKSVAQALYGDIKGKTVILVDDMTTSGVTSINATNLCLEHGAKNILAVIIHHDFSPDAPGKLEKSSIEKIFTTNTIDLKPNQKFNKLIEVNIAPLIADELKMFIK